MLVKAVSSAPEDPPTDERNSMSGSPDVVVIASAMIDMVSYVPRLPEAGETVRGETFALGFGGKGANQAVMAARAGARVHLSACLGDDVFGEMSWAHYQREGLELAGLRRVPGVTSGVAPIWVDPSGQNRIVVVPGANDSLDAAQAVDAVRSPARLDAVLSQMEVPQPSTMAAFSAARERGATTVLNPAPAHTPIPGLLELCDWVIVNETEFAALLAVDRGGDAAIDDEAMLAAAGRLGCSLVVTLGADGAAVVQGSRVRRVPAERVNVVDTTGAGDAFVGVFTALLAAGTDALDATRAAIACATASVTARGTQTSYPTRSRTAELLAAALGGR